MKRSGSGAHVFELALEQTEDILTFEHRLWVCLIFAQFASHVPARLPITGHFTFCGDLTQTAVIIVCLMDFTET